jgi:ribosomal protein S18 acetylase RimI-like enzyme
VTPPPPEPPVDLALLARLEHGMRTASGEGRSRRSLDGFDLFLSPDSSFYLLSRALPAEGAGPPWRAAIAALLAAYTPSGRRPRLEHFDELHPQLAPALEAAGFVLEMRAPVMALAPQGLVTAPDRGAANALRYRPLRHDDPQAAEAFVRGQSVAYGGLYDGPDALAWLPALRTGLEAGTLRAATLELEGRPVSGATLQLGGGVAELAGVWTDPEQRRRGLAFALCRRLLAEAFAAGMELCWLSAAEGGQGVYRRLGFVPVGTQLNYALAEG